MSIDNLIFSILLALCLSPGYAQESVVDSLENLITEVKVDTTTVNLLNKLALLSFDFSIPRSKTYATKALNLAREIGYPGGEALAAYRLSSILNAQGKLDSALSFIQQSQRQALELADSALFAKGLIEEGALQGKFDNDSLAIKHFFEALAIGKALKNDEICANSYSGLAIINTGLGYYNVAIDFLNQSLAAGEAANSAKLIAKACVNLAILHDSLTERKFYAEKALQVSSGRDNMNRERTYAYNTLGILHYYNLDQVDSALYFKKKGLKMAKASKDPALIQMISAS
ncbi:MAG: hypothetical protein HKN76_09585, partial [Saprospiraceae bacterium]|nr:hypothetical protein [Saprospiraceae bacterium]